MHLPQRPLPAAALLAPAGATGMMLTRLRRRRSIGTSSSNSCCGAGAGAIAALVIAMGRRRRWSACELLHHGAELGGVDDVHRRGRGVPASPVRPRGLAAAGSCIGGMLGAAALHQQLLLLVDLEDLNYYSIGAVAGAQLAGYPIRERREEMKLVAGGLFGARAAIYR